MKTTTLLLIGAFSFLGGEKPNNQIQERIVEQPTVEELILEGADRYDRIQDLAEQDVDEARQYAQTSIDYFSPYQTDPKIAALICYLRTEKGKLIEEGAPVNELRDRVQELEEVVDDCQDDFETQGDKRTLPGIYSSLSQLYHNIFMKEGDKKDRDKSQKYLRDSVEIQLR